MIINKVQLGTLIFAFTVAVTAFNCKKTTDSSVSDTTTSSTKGYNTLWIPPTLTGTTFNLTLGSSTKQLRTEVSDSGIGMEASDLSKLF